MIDSSRIKRRAMTNFRTARRTFEKAEAELTTFEQRDKPAYQRWYRQTFGPRIAEWKACLEERQAMEQKIGRLSRFASLKGCSFRDAVRIHDRSLQEFERIEAMLVARDEREQEEARRRAEEDRQRLLEAMGKDFLSFLRSQKRQIRTYLKQGTDPRELLADLVLCFCEETGAPPPWCEAVLEEPDGRKLLASLGLEGALEDDPEDGWDPAWEEELEDLFREMSGGQAPGDPVRPRGRTDPEGEQARLKALWRELAFSLHPDHQSGSDPMMMELWHQAQEAMAARDLDRLEVLHAHAQALRGELSSFTPVSRVQALTGMYREARDALRRNIRRLRQAPEWGFAKSDEAGRCELRGTLERDLAAEVAEARMAVEALQAWYRREVGPQPVRSARSRPDKTPRQTDLFEDL